MRHKYRPPHVSRAKIADYWTRRFGDELSDPLPDDRCWTCNRPDGRKYPLHRCHLVAEGPGSADNLILLCQKCHAKQEKRDPESALLWVLSCQAEEQFVTPVWALDTAKTKEGKAIVDAVRRYIRSLQGRYVDIDLEVADAIWWSQGHQDFWEEAE